MAPVQVPVLYTETRLDLAPASSASTVELSCSSAGNARSRKRVKYSHNASPPDLEEATLVRGHVATASSIYFRRKGQSPRAFLWRVLDDRKLLEIQAVDLHQDKTIQGDAVLTLRFQFQAPIRPFGIAFADPEEKHALVAFVITETGELFTLNLKREMWTDKRRVETEADLEGWCRSSTPSAFSFRTPYKLFAVSTHELVVSLHDGGLLRLERRAGDDGSHWRDTFFAEGGWGSTLRGLIPFKGNSTIRFGNVDLEPNTAAALALSADGQHFLTVGLDHVLRTWNLQTGKVGMQTDLLGENDITEKKVQYLIGPEQSQLLQHIEGSGSEGIQYYAVTFSPKGRRFKIWGILDADSGLAGLRDVRDDIAFVPPLEELLDASVCTLEEYYFSPKSHWRETEVWLRARSGPVSRVFYLKFDLFADTEDLQTAWHKNWVAVDGSSLSLTRLTSASPAAANDMSPGSSQKTHTEQWIDFLFHPGRFDTTMLTAALNAYNRPTNTQRSPSGPMKPLKQRLIEAVVATASRQHERTSASGELFESTLATQWRVFFSMVKDLAKRQAEPLSLAFDTEEDLPWLVLASYVSPVRLCSSIETLTYNSLATIVTSTQSPGDPLSAMVKDDADLDRARFLHAARGLRSIFPAAFQSALKDQIAASVVGEPSEDVNARIHAFDESLGLCARISDEEYSRLTESLSDLGGYEGLDNNLFFAVLDELTEPMTGTRGHSVITRYGAKALIRGSQETVQLSIEVLMDLLVLVVFLTLELDPSDLSPQFDGSDLFVELMAQCKEHLLLEWLVTTLRPNHDTVKPHKKSGAANESGSLLGDSAPSSPHSVTAEAELMTAQSVMESMFIGDWASISTPPKEPTTALLTYWCRAWTYGLDIGRNYEELTAHILTHLVKYNDVAIAGDFERFVPLTPWSGYVKGRLALLRGDPLTAALLFKSSSFGLALSRFNVNDPSPSDLLSPHEKNSFSEGLVPYYQHVITLFNEYRLHSFVIDFANLAIQALRAAATGQAETKQRESDLQSSLFTACLSSSRFEEAYSCLSDMAPVLRKASMAAFFSKLLAIERTSYAFDIFKRLPFTTTYNDADATLESLTAKSLNAATGQGARYHKALYALRVSRGDMRGAASALWTRIQWLRGGGERAADPETVEGAELMRCWLALINCLACVDTSQAWIFAEEQAGGNDKASIVSGGIDFGKPRSSLTFIKGAGGKQRTVLTLEDIRRLYQRELDRVEAVQEGRYAFDGANSGNLDAMDVL